MSKLSTVIMKILWNLIGALLTAATVIGLTQVIARYVFGHPFTWADVTSTLLFVWMLQMAIPVMFYKKSYLAFTLLEENMPPVIQKSMHVFIDLMCFLFSVCVLYGAIQLISKTGFVRPVPGVRWLPISYMYLSMVISMLCSAIITFDQIRVDILSFKEEKEGKEC